MRAGTNQSLAEKKEPKVYSKNIMRFIKLHYSWLARFFSSPLVVNGRPYMIQRENMAFTEICFVSQAGESSLINKEIAGFRLKISPCLATVMSVLRNV